MDVAAAAAWRAGRLTLGYFRGEIERETKADDSPVTVADRQSEALLKHILASEFPDDAILGEEDGEVSGSSGYRWIVDPIDGTKTFVAGVPLYGVLIGLVDPDGQSVLGVINIPALGELVVAAKGCGCFVNGRRARVSAVSDLSQACVVYTGDETFERREALDAKARVRANVRVMRSWGDCYGHVLVATGRAEAMLDPILAPWDIAALAPVIEEAGGVFTDWTGQATTGGDSAVSTNAALAEAIRALL
ncbi:MAG: histidinol-phosphatase [Myxococcales bacterium]|nr:histidinol-phosphatase [Myxococcales bacterium]